MKKVPKQKTPEMALIQAEGFYQTGLALGRELEKNKAQTTSLLGPAAVNYSFALELRLKSILMLDKEQFSKGHNLLKLYNLLSIPTKKLIEEEYLKLKKINNGLKAYRLQIYDKSKSAPEQKRSSTGDVIMDLLKSHENSFENWRYLFEFTEDGYSYDFDFEAIDNFYNAMNPLLESLLKKRPGKFGLHKVN